MITLVGIRKIYESSGVEIYKVVPLEKSDVENPDKGYKVCLIRKK